MKRMKVCARDTTTYLQSPIHAVTEEDVYGAAVIIAVVVAICVKGPAILDRRQCITILLNCTYSECVNIKAHSLLAANSAAAGERIAPEFVPGAGVWGLYEALVYDLRRGRRRLDAEASEDERTQTLVSGSAPCAQRHLCVTGRRQAGKKER